MPKKGKWISVKDMAEILGVSDRTVRRRMKSGLLTHKKVGRNYLVFLSEEDEQELGKEEPKEETKKKKEHTEDYGNPLVNVLVGQLEEKDKLIEELNKRLWEAHSIAYGKLLEQPKGQKEEAEEEPREQRKDEETTIYQVDEDEPKKKKKDRKFNLKDIAIWVFLALTLGLLAYMILQFPPPISFS